MRTLHVMLTSQPSTKQTYPLPSRHAQFSRRQPLLPSYHGTAQVLQFRVPCALLPHLLSGIAIHMLTHSSHPLHAHGCLSWTAYLQPPPPIRAQIHRIMAAVFCQPIPRSIPQLSRPHYNPGGTCVWVHAFELAHTFIHTCAHMCAHTHTKTHASAHTHTHQQTQHAITSIPCW